ncbi:DUF4747 family protein [Rhizobium leguminosarum]|uniref:DUF4747 family protein n=1 Tax=Rhizobium leguminosarum TaxID=384 RepID=UPI00103F36F5|nr:DUF4747 family protein [Rhizobium leguminosarum]TBZ17648.1 DUF4747 family protein [Rhizobium leguminosarum bv. viciae]
MERNPSTEYAILNIATNPHPDGIYTDILARVAGKKVNYYGSHFATISTPREIEEGFFQGRLATWVEIDTNEQAMDLEKLDPIDFDDLGLVIPKNVGFNGRVFLYTLRYRDHMLFVETLNEFGKRVAPSSAAKIFRLLFSKNILGEKGPVVEVTVIPEEDALQRIFKIPELKRLKIHLVRPNADDIDPAIVLEELMEQGARSQDIVLVAATDGDGLDPNKRTTTQAEVAETNGYVEGAGRDDNGTKIEFSTRAYPRIIRRTLGEIGGYLALALQVAKDTVVGQAGRKNL